MTAAKGLGGNLLEVRDLTASYGRAPVVKGVDLTVGAAEMVALLGSNGAGKTTFLRGLSGMIRTAGEILLDGESVIRLGPDAVTRAGLVHVPQGRGILGPLSVEENLRVGTLGRGERSTRSARVERAFDVFPQLRDRRTQKAGTLSGGEQQMLAIGRALAAEPRVLMVDEPSLGLSPKLTEQVLSTLARLRDELGTSVLVVEQNAHLVLQLADRGYVMSNGEIVLAGPAGDLADNPDVQRAYLGV
jgi:branched-chain amino acid transport system ATP-binding protein